MTDFAARLKFITEWYAVRSNPTLVNKGTLPTYDISKLFHPRGLLDAILLDYAATSHESVENLELEVAVLSGKQTLPPDRGCYINGFNLLDAGWDYAKGALREAKSNEPYVSLPCVSFFLKIF